jgi:hypothetical protein
MQAAADLVQPLPGGRLGGIWGRGVRLRWTTRFGGPDGPTAETETVLARVAVAVAPAAELLRNPVASATAPSEPGALTPAVESPERASLANRLGALGARIPLRLPRPVLATGRSPRRSARLPEAPNEGEYERRRDLDALVASLRRLQRPHVLILWIWWLFPLAVWVLAALGRQEMSFWRGFFVWLLMGFALSFPSMANRNQALDWARRTFLALFPVGSPARTEAMAELEALQGALIIRELVVRLRPPAAGAPTGPPVEQALREAISSLGGSPQGIPLPSDSQPSGGPASALAPAPRRDRPRPPPARSSGALPLTLPDRAPEDRRKP